MLVTLLIDFKVSSCNVTPNAFLLGVKLEDGGTIELVESTRN